MDFRIIVSSFKNNLFKSKRYWACFLLIFLMFTLFKFEPINFQHPKMEIIAFFIFSLLGISVITYFQSNKNDKDLYKTAFIIILLFGIIFSFVTPICYGPDEIEHFVRAEITSHGDFIPTYVNGSFKTIQSTVDLFNDTSKIGYDGYEYTSLSSTIFNTDADIKPINNTLIDYPNAFAQNPFYGYLAPALGILFAKLFDLNAIWMLWFARLFNVFLYASFSAFAVKKTPILKMPMLIFACLPLAIYLGATASIDSFINGLSLVIVAYFFYMYKSPENKLTKRNILIFSVLVTLVGFAKVTCFLFILLLLFIPKNNFKNEKYYYYGLISILISVVIAVVWTKFYANPGFFESWRGNKSIIKNYNSTQQIEYILHHKLETIFELSKIPLYFPHALIFSMNFEDFTDILRVAFLGFVIFFYPKKYENLKARIGVLFVSLIFYVGNYVTFLLSWTTVGKISAYYSGVQIRYFYPILALLPFIFSFDLKKFDKNTIDNWVIVILLLFISFRGIRYVIAVY